MTEMLIDASYLLKSKCNLLQLRKEPWLTSGEGAIVDEGIAALDSLLCEFSRNDSLLRRVAHQLAND